MLYDVKEDNIRLNGTSMDYAAFGCGSRIMVLIPGLSLRDVKGSGMSLAYMYRRFTKEFRIYCFDRRKRVTAGYTASDIAKDIAAGMDELGLRNACVLGVSQGGMAAQYLALERPDLVDKVVLGVTLAQTNSTVESCIKKLSNQFKVLLITGARQVGKSIQCIPQSTWLSIGCSCPCCKGRQSPRIHSAL